MSVDAKDFARAAKALERGTFERSAGAAVGPAMQQAGDVVRRNVRSKASRHRRTGRLERNVRLEVKGQGLGQEVKVRAGGMIAPMIVKGTRPHEIAPIRSNALVIRAPGQAGGVVGFAAVVQHPGMRPDPFLNAGVDASRAEIQGLADRAAETMVRELAGAMKGRR